MYAFSRGGSADPNFVSWPPPGYVPEQAARGEWSFASTRLAPTSSTVVSIALGEGAFQTVAHHDPGGGFGSGTTIAFDPGAGAWRAGTTARVRITQTRGGDVEYTVRFVDCS